MSTTRTMSPYFSPNSIVAPSARASSMVSKMRSGRILEHDAVDLVLDGAQLLGAQRPAVREVEAQSLGAHGRAGLADVLAERLRSARCSRWVPVWLATVGGRARPSTRACTASPGRSSPLEAHEQRLVAVEAVDRLDLPAHGVGRDLRRVGDLAAALGVERRLRQLDEREALAHRLDREHRRLDLELVVADELRCARAERVKRAMRSSSTRSPRRAAVRARSRCAPMCCSKPSRSMPSPASRAISAVSSTGKPCVSCSSKTSPACSRRVALLARPARSASSSRREPVASVCEKRSSSASIRRRTSSRCSASAG